MSLNELKVFLSQKPLKQINFRSTTSVVFSSFFAFNSKVWLKSSKFLNDSAKRTGNGYMVQDTRRCTIQWTKTGLNDFIFCCRSKKKEQIKKQKRTNSMSKLASYHWGNSLGAINRIICMIDSWESLKSFDVINLCDYIQKPSTDVTVLQSMSSTSIILWSR